jgi:hypothetical protein
MLGDRYVVKRGDNLWRIAARTLGSGRQWPRIWKHNNRKDVVRVTGRTIPNPDLIYIGQLLFIPRLPGTPAPANAADEAAAAKLPAAAETSGAASAPPSLTAVQTQAPSHGMPSSLSEQSRTIQTPMAFKYRLDTRWPPQDVGTAIVEVRMTGDILLMSKRSYPATFITNRGEVEHQVTHEANHAFGKLISDNRYIFDPAQKRVTFRSMLVSQSKTPNLPATAIGVEMSTNAPIPKLRAEIRIPKLEGSYNAFRYIALDVKVVLEITPKPQAPRPPTTQPVQPVVEATPSTSTNWKLVIGGAGLVVTAGLIAVATLAEDWGTLGAGTVDDPASFAASGYALARGLAMLGAASAALPAAANNASVTVTNTVQLAGTH